MTTRIVQKDPDRGTREFEIVDDAINYRISSPFGDEELTVVLSVLSPEPVVDGSMMYFVSMVNREALVKLFVDLPDAGTFAEFVHTLKQRITEEEFGKPAAVNRDSAITREQVDTTVHMLETYVDPAGIEELLSALRNLAEAPGDTERLNEVADAFNGLGMQQGPVLTYAPFFNTLLPSTDLDDLG